MMKPTLNTISYSTAIGLAAFSGTIATYGLTKFVPGSEIPVAVMGGLFECAKLSSLALIHRKALPRRLKVGLAAISLTLMTANVAGVAGMLSSAYTQRQLAAQATAHNAAVTTSSEVADLRRQLDAADTTLAQARTAVLKARDSRDRAKAAQSVVNTIAAERDAIAGKLRTATAAQAKGEADAIGGEAEFAAVRFLALSTGLSTEAVARIVILIISSVPDIAAAMLLWAATCATKTPVRRTTTHKTRKRTRQPALKVIPNAQVAKA